MKEAKRVKSSYFVNPPSFLLRVRHLLSYIRRLFVLLSTHVKSIPLTVDKMQLEEC